MEYGGSAGDLAADITLSGKESHYQLWRRVILEA